jgi:FtsZ-interacting cell division protein ZipA
MILDDFFDSGIYIVIVIIAAVVVVIAVASLNGMRKPKKQKNRRRNLLSESKRDHRQSTKLLDAPGNEKRREDKVKQKDKTKEKERKIKEDIEEDEPAEVTAMAHEETQGDSQEETQTQNTEAIDLPELPSVDTMEESDEEAVEENAGEDLMNIFQVEEAEDSLTSDLAANLFEVDLTSLEKLSKEVLGVYSGKKTEENEENKEE